MSSRAASRIAVAAGLAVVFGIGIFSVFVIPAMQETQTPAAPNTPAAGFSGDQTAGSPPVPGAAAPGETAPDASASARDTAAAPAAPPADASAAPSGH